MMSDFHPAGFRMMAHAVAEADMRDMLGDINVPTLLLYGEQDQRAPLDIAHALDHAIPVATLTTVPDVGHLLNCERPDIFNDAVSKFLQSVPSRQFLVARSASPASILRFNADTPAVQRSGTLGVHQRAGRGQQTPGLQPGLQAGQNHRPTAVQLVVCAIAQLVVSHGEPAGVLHLFDVPRHA